MSLSVVQANGSASPTSITFGSAMTPGDSMVVAIGTPTASRTVSSVTWSDGTNTVTVSTADVSVSIVNEHLYFFHIDAAAHAYTSLSVTWSLSTTTGGIIYAELAAATASSLDKTNSATTLSNTNNPQTGVLSQAAEIVIGGVLNLATGTLATPSGCTVAAQFDIGASHMAMAYKIVNATTSTGVSWSGLNTSSGSGAIVASYAAALGGGPGLYIQLQAITRAANW